MTHDEIRGLIDYDPETGNCTRRVARGRRYKAGDPVGSRMPRGYLQTNINGRGYLLHRVIWLWMTGEWPSATVDHKNGVPDDNRWENLRLASFAENQANGQRRNDNTSGAKGVWFNRSRQTWQAQISIGGRNKYLGVFKNREDAEAVVRAKRQELHGEFARHE